MNILDSAVSKLLSPLGPKPIIYPLRYCRATPTEGTQQFKNTQIKIRLYITAYVKIVKTNLSKNTVRRLQNLVKLYLICRIKVSYTILKMCSSTEDSTNTKY